MQNQNINFSSTNNSICIIGGIGAGKSQISKILAKQTGMKLLSLDILKYCPMSLNSISFEISALQQRIKKQNDRLLAAKSLDEIKEIKYNIENLTVRLNYCENQYYTRKNFPSLPNLAKLGFNFDIMKYFKETYGVEASFSYKHYFDVKLALEILNHNINAIKDFSGLSTIFFDKFYNDVHDKIQSIDNYDVKDFPVDINSQTIKSAFKNEKNVFYIKLDEDYKNNNLTAKKLYKVNDGIIASKQNEAIATHIIDSTGLIVKNVFNQDKANEIANNILRLSKLNKEEDKVLA